MTESLPIDGSSLTLDHFLAVVRGRCAVGIDPAARTTVAGARRSVERAVAQGRPIYGVTTGFGALSREIVPPAKARDSSDRSSAATRAAPGNPWTPKSFSG